MNRFILMIEHALYPFRALANYGGQFFRRVGIKSTKMTLAGKIAIAFFICFVIFLTVIWVVSAFSKGAYRINSITEMWFSYKITWLDFVLYYILAALISVGVYWGIRLATRDKPTLYPEIDKCWDPLNKWREKQNFEWHEFKRYLVLGPSLEVSKAMHAEMKNRKIGALPAGENEWMHWFGTNESVYLHLKKVCNTSAKVEKLSAGRGKGNAGIDPTNTLQASVGVPEWSASIGMDDVTAEVDSSFGGSIGFGASLDPSESLDPYESGEIQAPPEATEDALDESEILGEDGDTPMDRINYLCQMIRAQTEGEIPFHGVVVVIPFDKFMVKENYKTVTTAIKKDLLAIRQQTEVKFPVSFVFCSMEKDQGFPKLQNLLGSQRAESGRFGAGCKAEDIPVIDKKNLSIQVQRACRSFEDWVVNRWGKSSQLSRAAQNKELFKMIVRIRQKFQPNFQYLVENTLLWTESEMPDNENDLSLAGCYFVSTGKHASERGFLNGVFLKCEEFADTAGWGTDAIDRDRNFSVLGTMLFAASMLTVIGAGIFIYLNG
jgi:hypothetical protein